MAHTLVTFLGRGLENRQIGYRKATYQFPDGWSRETAFFGLALAHYLEVDRAVILGTSGSMWGVLVENLAREGQDEEARLELLEAETQKAVTQNILDRVESIMSRTVGRAVLPRLVSFGANPNEQYDILTSIADAIPNGQVSFDLTHGFRHLGMIGFLSAFMLEQVRHLNVCGLWYGALDMTGNGTTPVLQLDGLTRVRRWVEALDRFDATGDYGVFAPLLIEDDVPEDKARCLKDAAFFERISNDRDAKRKLDTFLPVLNTPLSGASGLFQERLKDRLEWAKEPTRAKCQHKLALQYLERTDFVRAAIFGLEAFITHECSHRQLNPDERKNREAVTQTLNTAGNLVGDKYQAYRTLNALRNTMAHGTLPKQPEIKALLGNRSKLREVIEREIKRLLA